jgi:trans-2,3-dihydro-3-hydroxyanthranilate isomerase
MTKIPFYVVDVFASNKYEGNQLAVFVDLENQVSDEAMQSMAREINFAETTFIKTNQNDERFGVRIFTPEHEIPFAGHPSIGTSYVIAKFLLPQVPSQLVLELEHIDIAISILDPTNIDQSLLFMQQAQPEFREYFTHQEVATELGIDLADLNLNLPIQEVTTGLPYIIIPLKNLAAIEKLSLREDTFQAFLEKRKKYRINSTTGHSTSLFFFTNETYHADNQYNARMKLLENGRLSEDAATGSANGCLLAYLLKHSNSTIKATVEQGFQMGRKSFLYLDGSSENDYYVLKIGGHTQLVSEGFWYV